MTNLIENYENSFTSTDTFNAEDSKPFKWAVCVSINEVENNKYLICVNAAKLPKYLAPKQRQSVASCMCITTKQITVNDVCEYGLSASLDSFLVNESEIDIKLTEIDKHIPVYGMMCGFYFDKVNNRCGNTGWDFLNGNIG